MSQPQLVMSRKGLDDLPEMLLPEGYQIRAYQPGDETAWAEVINSTGNLGNWDVNNSKENLTQRPQFWPDGLFLVTHNDEVVGTACAWRESPDDTEIGWLHMVAVKPEHQGKHLGYFVSLAVLRYFKAKDFLEVRLLTDDFRLAAIKIYLDLGFEPLYRDESHHNRWPIVFQQLGLKR